jgi:hypothetical protein
MTRIIHSSIARGRVSRDDCPNTTPFNRSSTRVARDLRMLVIIAFRAPHIGLTNRDKTHVLRKFKSRPKRRVLGQSSTRKGKNASLGGSKITVSAINSRSIFYDVSVSCSHSCEGRGGFVG